DQIILAVKVALTDRKIKRRDVLKATILRLKKTTSRSNGMKMGFEDNAVTVYNKRNELMGTRLFGPVTQELRIATGKKKHTKILENRNSFILMLILIEKYLNNKVIFLYDTHTLSHSKFIKIGCNLHLRNEMLYSFLYLCTLHSIPKFYEQFIVFDILNSKQM